MLLVDCLNLAVIVLLGLLCLYREENSFFKNMIFSRNLYLFHFIFIQYFVK